MQVWQILAFRNCLLVIIFFDCFVGYHGGVTGLTCGGDSGSPLVFFNSEERHYVQVGIVSGGSCQSKTDPSIFARIEDHQTLEFIRKQFWEHIAPTSVQAIEKLMTENKVLRRRLDDLQENLVSTNTYISYSKTLIHSDFRLK